MGYVAIKGGGKAIKASLAILELLRSYECEEGDSISIDAIETGLRFLTYRVVSEGGLYHPKLAALAIKQMQGDPLEAAFALRAYRSTKPRIMEIPPHKTDKMRIIRRISSAFKDIPKGQILGPTFDYSLRLMRFDLVNEKSSTFKEISKEFFDEITNSEDLDTFPKVVDFLRKEGLLYNIENENSEAFDITREPLIFPIPRSAMLASMARGETGSMLALAYSNMRGYGDVHPTIAELRVGYVPIEVHHPITNEIIEAGEVLITECEVISMYEQSKSNEKPLFTLGYGACFGHNETKAICMAILDKSLQKGMKDGPQNPSEDPEFVILHIDGVDSMGFSNHYKMPHYVTFQSDLDRLRTTQSKYEVKKSEQIL